MQSKSNDGTSRKKKKEESASYQQDNIVGEEKPYILWYAKACAKFISVELDVSLW